MCTKPHHNTAIKTPVITTDSPTLNVRIPRRIWVFRANESPTRPIEKTATIPTPAKSDTSITWPKSDQSTRGVDVTN